MYRWALLGVGVVASAVGFAAIAGQALSGVQPWGATLSDNMVFARSIPFTLGLGVVVGAVWGMAPSAPGVAVRADGAVRRFSPGTIALHWIAALGFVLALVTGAWQFLKGILDVDSPVFMPFVYRVHYIGATLLLFAVSCGVTCWWIRDAHSLLVPRGQWIRHLRGLANELPRPLGGLLAGFLGLEMKRTPPPVEQFTYYEKVVSFPAWAIFLTLVIVTGLLKAMRYVYPIPGEVLWWASALHVGALVLLAARLLDHVRYVLAPLRWPLLMAMVSGWVSERYVRHRHPAWHQAIQDQQRRPPAEAPTTPQASPLPPRAPAVRPAEGGHQ
jgi:cytochrome b subunit of formate dehydrogenase